jgi:hypothetical protein
LVTVLLPANEKKVTRLIKEKKEELNIRGDSQYENEVYFFTCAAHKINNMALAMTDKSAKFLYTTDSNGCGMIGAQVRKQLEFLPRHQPLQPYAELLFYQVVLFCSCHNLSYFPIHFLQQIALY